MATETKERMPYLMGAKGAASIFWFPVAGKNGIPGIKVKQLTAGFEHGVEIKNNQQGHIQIGMDHRGDEYCVNLMDFKRHTIITGFTGSGKTNSLLFLLNQ